MTRILPLMLVLALVLGIAPGVSAWHWENEEENSYYGSQAGDPRTVQDAGECLEDVKTRYEVTCIVLYPHLGQGIDSVPVNAQRPMDCSTGLEEAGGTAPVGPGWVHEGYTWYSAPSFVQYHDAEDGGPCEPGYHHPVRGLKRDLVLSPEFNITGYIHLSSESTQVRSLVPPPAVPKTGVGTMPCVTVEFTLQTGRIPGEGDVIAQGSATKTVTTLPDHMTPDPPPVDDPCPESQGPIEPEQVTEFQVDLGTTGQEIPAHDGYLVHVRWYQWDGDSLPVTAQQSQWRLHAGPDHVNRVVIPVVRSLETEITDIREFDGKMYIRTATTSPMGSYDVDAKNIRIQLLGEAGHEIPMKHLDDPLFTYSIDHDGLLKPVIVTFPWDQDTEDLEAGTYTIRVVAANWQHTDVATTEMQFTIPQQIEVEESPGPVLPVLPLVLALGAFVLGRRT